MMNVLDRADIQTSGRLHRNQKLRILIYFTGNDRLLLIAAGHAPGNGHRTLSGTHVILRDQLFGICPDIFPIQKACLGDKLRFKIAFQNDIVLQRIIQNQSVFMSVLRDMAHIFIPFTDTQVCNIPAAKTDLAAFHRLQSGQSVNKFCLSVSVDTCDTNDLSCTHLKRDIFDRIVLMYLAGHRHVFDIQNHIARLRFLFFNRKGDITTNHHAGKLFLGGVLDVDRSDILALAQNRTPVGNFHNFIQFMGNKEDRLALGRQTFHDLHEFCDLLRCQDCCRLIENQDLIVPVKHFENLCSLLHTDADIFDHCVRVHIQSVFFGQFIDPLLGLGLFQKPMLVRLYAQNNIIEHRKALNQLEVLMYHTDPQLVRNVRIADFYRLTVLADFARLRLV